MGIVSISPGRMRARRPRSRVGPARSLVPVTASHAGPLPRKARQACLYGDRCDFARPYAGETPAFPGGSGPQPYFWQQPPMQGHSVVKRAKPALMGIVSISPGRMRAGRPRSRVGPACSLVPGTASHAGPLPRKARQACLNGDRFYFAKPYAGETPAFPGGRDACAPGWAFLFPSTRPLAAPSLVSSNPFGCLCGLLLFHRYSPPCRPAFLILSRLLLAVSSVGSSTSARSKLRMASSVRSR